MDSNRRCEMDGCHNQYPKGKFGGRVSKDGVPYSTMTSTRTCHVCTLAAKSGDKMVIEKIEKKVKPEQYIFICNRKVKACVHHRDEMLCSKKPCIVRRNLSARKRKCTAIGCPNEYAKRGDSGGEYCNKHM
jgi:hypothetical protein